MKINSIDFAVFHNGDPWIQHNNEDCFNKNAKRIRLSFGCGVRILDSEIGVINFDTY